MEAYDTFFELRLIIPADDWDEAREAAEAVGDGAEAFVLDVRELDGRSPLARKARHFYNG